MKFIKKLYVLPTVLFFCILLSMAWKNRSIPKTLGSELTMNRLEDYTDSLEDRLKDGLKEKYDFINLNGWMTNLLGINSLNEIQKLANGWLTDEIVFSGFSTARVADNLQKLSNALEEQGIGFLAVPITKKSNFYDAEFSLGYQVDYHTIIEQFFQNLTDRQVPHLNMDSWYRENGWTMEKTYFKSDHHWTPAATLAAVEQIVKRLSEDNADITYSPELFEDSSWNTEIYKDWFLGSHGRRTGIPYTGVDDLPFMTPAFATDVTVDRINAAGRIDLTHLHSVYIEERLEQPEYFEASALSVYLGANYPVAYIRNRLAVNDKKIIVLGDSFRLPLETFLCTQFSEIYHIDMRYYTEGTFWEFVREIQPDYVLDVYNGFYDGNDSTYDYGLADWEENYSTIDSSPVLLEQQAFRTESAAGKNTYQILQANLETGSYRLELDGLTLVRDTSLNDKEHSDLVQAALLNTADGSIVKSRFLISGHSDPQIWYFTVPEDTDASYALILYSGVNGETYADTVSADHLVLQGNVK